MADCCLNGVHIHFFPHHPPKLIVVYSCIIHVFRSPPIPAHNITFRLIRATLFYPRPRGEDEMMAQQKTTLATPWKIVSHPIPPLPNVIIIAMTYVSNNDVYHQIFWYITSQLPIISTICLSQLNHNCYLYCNNNEINICFCCSRNYLNIG